MLQNFFRAQGLYTNYVTNGFITEEAFDMIAPFLDVYRVDIKGFTEETYMRIGHIKEFGESLRSRKSKGVWDACGGCYKCHSRIQ